MKDRIICLLDEMNRGVYEKETEIGLSLLAALAGESVLLLGPPGVAKSMVARRLKQAFAGARSFEYLMSRFSTPDELFGPVSISRLKESDQYERRVEGYLPTADVVFLDEIWKAGPAIQNALLTALNEKLFRNGDHELRIPLKLLVAASNELPAQGEGLEALWDRFLVRLVCSCIRREETFRRMLLDEADEACSPVSCPVTPEEYADWQSAIRKMDVPDEVLESISSIRHELSAVVADESGVRRSVYVSDRRWKHIVRLLRVSAWMHDRPSVSPADLLPLYHCLWNEPDEREAVRAAVIRAVFTPCARQIADLSGALKNDLRLLNVAEALKQARLKGDHRDDSLKIYNHLYYLVENHGTGHTYIFLVDYRNLKAYDPKAIPTQGIIYPDPRQPKHSLIRAVAGQKPSKGQTVTLARDDFHHLYINGVRYSLQCLERGETQQSDWIADTPPAFSGRDYEAELEQANRSLASLTREAGDLLFLSDDERKAVSDYASTLRQQIAYARADARKLLYGDE